MSTPLGGMGTCGVGVEKDHPLAPMRGKRAGFAGLAHGRRHPAFFQGVVRLWSAVRGPARFGGWLGEWGKSRFLRLGTRPPAAEE